ncbi:hypothetical protein E2C01_082551 [Portunus trituberculatus]|uniref:Uncharacterized protein n=1 Tax=Portunus trituberculatus TaxID=210409 RepID=A0A5B7IZF4_PORTR|nr:hypothetical protein [Portunus trituberculatus]
MYDNRQFNNLRLIHSVPWSIFISILLTIW